MTGSTAPVASGETTHIRMLKSGPICHAAASIIVRHRKTVCTWICGQCFAYWPDRTWQQQEMLYKLDIIGAALTLLSAELQADAGGAVLAFYMRFSLLSRRKAKAWFLPCLRNPVELVLHL